MSTFSTEDYKRKIAGLLAKAEGTDNAHEQEAFSRQAERLMLKMGIDRAEVEAAGSTATDPIVHETRTWGTIYAPTMNVFSNTVAHGFSDAIQVLQTRFGKNQVVTHFVGHKSDVEQFLTLLDSLNIQVWAAVKAYRKENRDTRKYYTIHENFVTDRSFIEGYGSVVRNRLQAMRREETAEASPGAALVLVSRAEVVKDSLGGFFPKMGTARASRRQSSTHARIAGGAAGAKARLGETSLPQGKSKISG